MKEIKAFIKPHKLSDVTLALHKLEGMTGMSVSNVKGFGRLTLRKADQVMDFFPYVRIEIICRNELLDRIVEIIKKTAQTGLRGDGRIFVSDVDQSIRISTGERENGLK
ncbi:MAG: P-II family nitrogen regulator [Deltaproteobacteria bacterium]|nr:P-II family nitrogen regulator [Deltaproteobacteria bacterium]MBW1816514.1 P-II family nitrogen regulator [Deltaproteobacteria bacterium]